MKKTSSILGAIFLAANLYMAAPLEAKETTTGTIEVANPTDGVTYYAYKIFDVEYGVLDEDKGHYSYTIKDTDFWYDCITDYIDSEDGHMTKVEKGDSTGVYYIMVDDGFGAAKFAQALKAYLETHKEELDTIRTELDGTPPKVTDLPLGYYLVLGEYSDEEGVKFEALANLTTTDPDVTIYQKNSVDFKKEVNDTSVELGQTVTYTISGRIPNTEGYSKYSYSIHDTLPSGLTLDKDSIEVLLENEDKTSFVAFPEDKYTLTKEKNGFNVSLKVMKLQEYKGRKIQVKYNATVNEKAISKISENNAELTYSNDPADPESKDTATDKKDVYTSTLELQKYELDSYGEVNTKKKLEGAVFVLSKDEDGKKDYYYYSDGKVTWVNDLEKATSKTTDKKGKASFEGLEDGTYYLVETKAPDGYNKLTFPVKVEIDGKSATKADLSPLTSEKVIGNGAGMTLPVTGAGGVGPYIFGGQMVMAGTAIVAIARRYKKYNHQ